MFKFNMTMANWQYMNQWKRRHAQSGKYWKFFTVSSNRTQMRQKVDS